MSVFIAEAVHNEYNKYSGGTPGDQSGDEVRIRKWYSRPWNFVLRLKDANMRNRMAYAMRAAANNSNIGYNQYQRNTLLTYSREVRYDPGKVKTKCDCDCSSLVSVALMYAGLPENKFFKYGNCSTTANLRARLKPYCDIFAAAEYTTKSDKLIGGDILLYENHHVAVVVECDNKIVHKTITDIAKEVLAGVWGDGEQRKKALINAGYNYSDVQKEVNRLVHENN